MRLVLLLLVLAIVGVPVLLWLSARAGLDRSHTHTRATEALPSILDGARDGLVRIPVGARVFRARVAGLGGDGPALVLLHGFPETSIMWTPLLERAADAGFRVVAFDQRGYSPGARPTSVDAYDVDTLVGDVLDVADAAGFDRFHLVGHDWGAIVGWAASAARPDRVVSWASLSIPHPGAILPPGGSRRAPPYIHVFRTRGLAETLLGHGRRRLLHRVAWSSMSPDHRAEYEAVFSEPGALTAALAWYRAMVLGDTPFSAAGPVAAPTLYVYGRNDIAAFVNPGVQERLPAFVTGDFERIELDAGHWLIQDEETVVVDAVMAHLERHR